MADKQKKGFYLSTEVIRLIKVVSFYTDKKPSNLVDEILLKELSAMEKDLKSKKEL